MNSSQDITTFRRMRTLGRGTPFAHVPARNPQEKKSVSPNFVARKKAITKPAASRTQHSSVLLRAATSRPSQKKIRSTKTLGQKVVLVLASFVFLTGVGVAIVGYRTNRLVQAQVKTVTENAQDGDENALPTEEKPSDSAFGSYAVDPSLPRYVRISKLGVSARVMRAGLDKKGALKAPGNIHNAGWYENSSKPGEGGAVLLDGHVAGPTQHGVFYEIKKLVPGDIVEIERGDGSKFNYKVVKSQVSDATKTDMSDALLSVVEGKPGLNLITCTGNFSAQTGKYDQRITVYAVQI